MKDEGKNRRSAWPGSWGAWLILGSFFLGLFFPLAVRADTPKIGDILVTVKDGQLLVYAKVTDCFTKDMEAAILAGVPTTFTFYLHLFQERSFWWDEKIADVAVKHTVKYDSVKKVYHVSADEGPEIAQFQDFESAKNAMAELNGIPIGHPRDLRKDRPAYVTIKAKLDKVRLPLHLEYVFFFVSLWDFETGWHKKAVAF